MVRNHVGGLRYLEDDVRTDDFETLSATQVDEIVSGCKVTRSGVICRSTSRGWHDTGRITNVELLLTKLGTRCANR